MMVQLKRAGMSLYLHYLFSPLIPTGDNALRKRTSFWLCYQCQSYLIFNVLCFESVFISGMSTGKPKSWRRPESLAPFLRLLMRTEKTSTHTSLSTFLMPHGMWILQGQHWSIRGSKRKRSGRFLASQSGTREVWTRVRPLPDTGREPVRTVER